MLAATLRSNREVDVFVLRMTRQKFRVHPPTRRCPVIRSRGRQRGVLRRQRDSDAISVSAGRRCCVIPLDKLLDADSMFVAKGKVNLQSPYGRQLLWSATRVAAGSHGHVRRCIQDSIYGCSNLENSIYMTYQVTGRIWLWPGVMSCYADSMSS
jgi:hypothetical protein